MTKYLVQFVQSTRSVRHASCESEAGAKLVKTWVFGLLVLVCYKLAVRTR